MTQQQERLLIGGLVAAIFVGAALAASPQTHKDGPKFSANQERLEPGTIRRPKSLNP